MARAQAKRSLNLRAKGVAKLFSRGVENLSTSIAARRASPNRQVNLASIKYFEAKPAVQLPGRTVPFIDG